MRFFTLKNVDRELPFKDSSVIIREFKQLSKGNRQLQNAIRSADPPFSFTGAQRELNIFNNIAPYDSNYVSSAAGGYVNASFIRDPRVLITDGKLLENKQNSHMIAAQTPIKNGLQAFWQAVLVNGVTKIVMLCSFCEKDVVSYFTDAVGESLTFGDISIRTVREDTSIPDIILRELDVESGNGSSASVRHIQVLKWPDSSLPSAEHTINYLLSQLDLDDLKRTNSRALVHCRAGIGRTGTLLTLWILFYLISTTVNALNERFSVQAIVAELRKDRPFMVQTPSQYYYIYELLAKKVSAMMVNMKMETACPATSSETAISCSIHNCSCVCGMQANWRCKCCDVLYCSKCCQQQLHPIRKM